ncbi:uncharacterized protein LOC120288396 [Eucalyptus grandis]|uniref:uncharacterized protein LOC120288396 n=1 Tax=Eucalyptus grandis TaxID=71139 RepID=UPI00192EC410|nr:uncharacterized protein LOC120288396 [Eucalyptus grandis]
MADVLGSANVGQPIPANLTNGYPIHGTSSKARIHHCRVMSYRARCSDRWESTNRKRANSATETEPSPECEEAGSGTNLHPVSSMRGMDPDSMGWKYLLHHQWTIHDVRREPRDHQRGLKIMYVPRLMDQNLSQFMHKPKESHMNAALKVVKYLKGCPGLEILLSRKSNVEMTAYYDADYAMCPMSRRSIIGLCIKLGDSLISWKTKKQATVSLSSVEAEYWAMAKTTCEVVWIRGLLSDLGVRLKGPTRLYCDNKSALKLAMNPIQLVRGARDELDSLKDTVKTIRAVLLDAEKQQWHNHQVKLWLERLRDVLYDVYELLDDVATEDLRQKVMPGNKMSKVRLLRETLGKEKYLLVLDDMWNEDRLKWLALGDWLKGGKWGSKILVTTRSHTVAKVTNENSAIYDLEGLTTDKSWDLFREVAFGERQASVDQRLEEMGRDIVRKCAGVPLAIRTIGSLLYGRKEDQWNRYRVKELPEIPEIDAVDNGIMQVLKFSYDHLPSCLKHCFAYCSLFPKDHIYKKETMMPLWVAQGFIESCNGRTTLKRSPTITCQN